MVNKNSDQLCLPDKTQLCRAIYKLSHTCPLTYSPPLPTPHVNHKAHWGQLFCSESPTCRPSNPSWGVSICFSDIFTFLCSQEPLLIFTSSTQPYRKPKREKNIIETQSLHIFAIYCCQCHHSVKHGSVVTSQIIPHLWQGGTCPSHWPNPAESGYTAHCNSLYCLFLHNTSSSKNKLLLPESHLSNRTREKQGFSLKGT